MKKKAVKPTRGGYRPGSGRKAGPSGTRENVSFTMPSEIRDFLEVAAGDLTRSQFVEAILRASPQFLEWCQKKI